LVLTSAQVVFFFSSRRRHTRSKRDWSSDVCSSDLESVEDPLHLVSVARSLRIIGVSGLVQPRRHRSGAGGVLLTHGGSCSGVPAPWRFLQWAASSLARQCTIRAGTMTDQACGGGVPCPTQPTRSRVASRLSRAKAAPWGSGNSGSDSLWTIRLGAEIAAGSAAGLSATRK